MLIVLVMLLAAGCGGINNLVGTGLGGETNITLPPNPLYDETLEKNHAIVESFIYEFRYTDYVWGNEIIRGHLADELYYDEKGLSKQHNAFLLGIAGTTHPAQTYLKNDFVNRSGKIRRVFASSINRWEPEEKHICHWTTTKLNEPVYRVHASCVRNGTTQMNVILTFGFNDDNKINYIKMEDWVK